LPVLGAWKALGDRATVGLEAQLDFRSWTRYLNGDPTRSVSGTDWALAVGPAARWRLARTGDASFFLHGSLLWGRHRFGPSAGLGEDPAGAQSLADPGLEFAFQPGVGVEWAISERWALGGLYSARWLSGETIQGTADRWRAPKLAITLRYFF
jgi:hypothetical protein